MSEEMITEITVTPSVATEEVTEAVATTPFEEEVTSQLESTTEEATEPERTTSSVEEVTTMSEEMTTEATETPGVTTEEVTETVRTTPFEEEVTSQYQSTTGEEEVTEAVRTTTFEEEMTSRLVGVTTRFTETSVVATEKVTEEARTTPAEEEVTPTLANGMTEFTKTPIFTTVGSQYVSTTAEEEVTEPVGTTPYPEEITTVPEEITTGLNVTPDYTSITSKYTSTTAEEEVETTHYAEEVTTKPGEITTKFTETSGVSTGSTGDQSTTEEVTEASTAALRTTTFSEEMTAKTSDITTVFTETPDVGTGTSRAHSTTGEVTEAKRTSTYAEELSTKSSDITTVFTETPGVATGTSNDQSTTEEVTEAVRTTPFEKGVTSQYYTTDEAEATEAVKSTTFFEQETTSAVEMTTSTTQGESITMKEAFTTEQVNPSSQGPLVSTEVPSATTSINASTEEAATTQGEIATTEEKFTTRETITSTAGSTEAPSSEGPVESTEAPVATTRGVSSTAESASTTEGESATTKETITTMQVNPSSEGPVGSTEASTVTRGVASTAESVSTTEGESATTKKTVTTRQTNPSTDRPAESTDASSSEGPVESTEVPAVTTRGDAPTAESASATMGETATIKESITMRQTNPISDRLTGSTGSSLASTGVIASTAEPEVTTVGDSTTTKQPVTTRQTVPATERPAVSTEVSVASTVEASRTTEGDRATTKETVTTRQTHPATERPAVSTEVSFASTMEASRTTEGDRATTKETVTSTQTNPPTERPMASTEVPISTTSGVTSTVVPARTTQGDSATTKETGTTSQTNPATDIPAGSTEPPVASTDSVASTAELKGTTQGDSATTKGTFTTVQVNTSSVGPIGSTEAPVATTRDQQPTTKPPLGTTSGPAVTSSAPPSFTTSVTPNMTNVTSPSLEPYNEAMTATATILELNGDEAFLSPPLQDPTSPVFLNFQASLCNALLEYFQDLSISTDGIQCRVTNLVSGSIIASMEFNVTGVNQEDALTTAEAVFNSQFMIETFLIDSRSRNVFTFGSFLVDSRDTCGLETPCRNGATCRGSGYNSFTCVCPDGWTGDTCEDEFLIVLEVVDVTDTVVDLAWDFLDDDSLVAFVFEYRKSGEDDWMLSTLISRTLREHTIMDLEPSTLYFVRLLGFFTEETRVISFQKAFITTEAVIVPDTGAAQRPQALSNSVLIWILVVVALVAFVLFIFVVVMVYRRRRDSVTLPFRDFGGRFAVGVRDNVAYDFEIQGGPPSPPSVSAMALGSDRSGPSTSFWEIPRERLVVGNRRQYGRFGEIFFGKVHIRSQSLDVDIKKQGGTTPLDKKKMLAELSILSHVGRHANILNLVGACSKSSGPVYLAFERMEPVRLDVFLRTVHDVHKPVAMHVPGFNITTPLMPLLLKLAVDVASGLSHLASKRIVQHSLGVRNIALTVDLVAKVTDFAIQDENQSTGRAVNGDSQSLFPSSARWMAFETLVYSTCTEQSNVWSLGVIIWEIMSFGREPFNGFHVDELSRKLTEGYTLNQPDGCLDDIYEIIQNCLRLEPKERPLLKILVARLVRRYQSIKLQDKETRAEVFQSLAQLSDNHDNMTPPQIRSMEMLVNGNIEKELPQARLMAVQYAATAFPGSHIASKYTLLTACGDEIEVVRTEAINIIKMQARIAEMDMESDTPSGKMLPAFPQMINHIRMKAFDNLPSSSQKSQGPLGVFTIPFKALVYEKVAVYLRMCLAYSAGVSPNAFKTIEMKKQGPALSRYVNDLMDMYAGDASAPISTYTGLLRQYVSAIGGGRGTYSLLEIVAMAPDKLAPQFVKKTDSLKMLLHSDEEAVRLYTAQLLGVVLCYAPPPLVIDTIKSFTSRLETGSIESCQAMIWALGFIIGRQMQKEILANKDTFSRLTDTHNLVENIYRRATEAIVTKLDSSSPTLVKAACTAIAEIGRNGPIPLPKGGKTNGRSTTKGSSESVRSKNGATGPTKLSLVQRLTEIFIRDSVLFLLEVKKEAASALAYLMVGEAEFPYTKLVLEALPKGLKISAPSREQLYPFQFHLADALSTALQGPSAPAAVDPWLEETTTPLGRATPTNGDLKALLETLLTDRQKTNNSDEKEAISVMLTVLLEQFRHNQSIQDREAEMMSIIKDAVMDWDASGIISELPRDLQKRILQVLKLTRVASNTSSSPTYRMDSSDSSDSPTSRMDIDEPVYAVVRRVTPELHSSSADSSEDTAQDVTAMIDDITNEDEEVTSF